MRNDEGTRGTISQTTNPSNKRPKRTNTIQQNKTNERTKVSTVTLRRFTENCQITRSSFTKPQVSEGQHLFRPHWREKPITTVYLRLNMSEISIKSSLIL